MIDNRRSVVSYFYGVFFHTLRNNDSYTRSFILSYWNMWSPDTAETISLVLVAYLKCDFMALNSRKFVYLSISSDSSFKSYLFNSDSTPSLWMLKYILQNYRNTNSKLIYQLWGITYILSSAMFEKNSISFGDSFCKDHNIFSKYN